MVTRSDEQVIEANSVKERPVFIPPRKRHTNKKSNGTQNYVDHIANVQVNKKMKGHLKIKVFWKFKPLQNSFHPR